MFINSLKKLDVNSFINSKPLFTEKNFSYIREEKDGFVTCYSKKAPYLNTLVINPTALRIIQMCNGERKPNDIVKEILNVFAGVTQEIAYQDLITVLLEYSKSGLISWVGGINPFMYTYEKKLANGYTISIAQEDDLLKLCEFFKNENGKDAKLSYENPTRNMDEYTDEMTYRQKLFAFSEEYFLLKNNEGQIEGIVTILIPVIKISTVSTLGVVRISPEYFLEVMDFAKEILKEIAVEEITKIKLQVVEDKPEDKCIAEKLSAAGFVKEGILKKELGNKNLEIYSYLY